LTRVICFKRAISQFDCPHVFIVAPKQRIRLGVGLVLLHEEVCIWTLSLRTTACHVWKLKLIVVRLRVESFLLTRAIPSVWWLYRGEDATGCTRTETSPSHKQFQHTTQLPSATSKGLRRPRTASSSSGLFPNSSTQTALSFASGLVSPLRHPPSHAATSRPRTAGGGRGASNRFLSTTASAPSLLSSSLKDSSGGIAASQSNRRSVRLTLPSY
jgi:hypothetical protein